MPINSRNSMLDNPLTDLELTVTEAVFEALVHHTGLSVNRATPIPPQEFENCFNAAISFSLEVHSNCATLDEPHTLRHWKAALFRAKFLRSCLEPALKPLKLDGLTVTRQRSAVMPLVRTKTQLSRMKRSEQLALGMTELSHHAELQELALAECTEEVLRFLRDSQLDLRRLTLQLLQRVTAAQTRAVRLEAGLLLLGHGSYGFARMHCTQHLLLQLASDDMHFIEGLNGCGRMLRDRLTSLWQQCIATVSNPLIASPDVPPALQLAALSTMSIIWDDRDLEFLHQEQLWNNLQYVALGMTNSTSETEDLSKVLWALLAQMALVTFRKKSESVQREAWERGVLESISAVIDPIQNPSCNGVNEMFGLAALCLPVETELQNKQLLVHLLKAVVPLVSSSRILVL